jgi:hypothetical protein
LVGPMVPPALRGGIDQFVMAITSRWTTLS